MSFDSFNPRPVTLRTIFKIAIFLSAGTESKITSKDIVDNVPKLLKEGASKEDIEHSRMTSTYTIIESATMLK